MGQITYVEVCDESEIRFLREGDYQYQIEGVKNVDKFLIKLKEYSLFDYQEEEYLKDLGLEEFHKEFDFKHTLNLLDRIDIKVLDKFSQQIN